MKTSWLIAIGSLVALTSCLNDNDVVDPIEQLEKEQDRIDAYLDENGIEAKIDTTGYDLRYVIHEQGDGSKPKLDDWTLVDIKGTRLDGVEFINEDSIYIPINNWLLGYYVLTPYLNEGGSMSMYLPSYFAYGNSAAFDGLLPKNSTVILDVTLHDALTQFDYEQQKIDNYLAENGLEAEIDTTKNLRYIITEEGTGDYPAPNSTVNVDYKLTILGEEEPLQNGAGFENSLRNLIAGWQILMPYVKEGGTIQMFIPSKYAYGATGSNTIPGYSTLIFEVKLNTVK